MPLSVSERLGDFRILGELGAGGMGSVYRAELLAARPWGSAGTQCALKVLNRGTSDERAVRRLCREFELARAVRHRNLARMYELGEDGEVGESGDDGMRWLVMELVEGESLEAKRRALGALPEALVRDIGAQVADALAALHARKIVHRDVKPHNIMLTPANEVKLVDFGIAYREAADEGLTTTPHVTHAYLAPERLRLTRTGPACDVYALGVTLHELIAGGLPFTGSDERILRGHACEVPPPLGRVRPDCSRFIEALVAAMLVKSPTNRPTAERVARILADGEDGDWWREQARTTGDSLFLRRTRRLARGSLHGREAELAHLLQAWDATSVGEGCVVSVGGEAGVGKTRFAEELARRVEDEVAAGGEDDHADPLLLFGACGEVGSDGPLGAIGIALRSGLAAAGSEAELARLVGSAAVAQPLAAALDPRSLERPDPETLSVALRALIDALTRRTRLLLVIDDAHLATGRERELLHAIARMTSGRSLLLVVVGRPPFAVEELPALRKGARLEQVVLGPLDASAVAELLRSALGPSPAAERLAPGLTERCGGNPLFLLELVRALEQRESVVRDDEQGWYLTDERDVTVPPSVRDLMLARLHDLADPDRDLLDAAAIQGHVFDAELLARTLGRTPLEVLQTLARLGRSHGLVHAVGNRFAFDHQQLHEVIRDEVSPGLAAEHHRRIARAHAEIENLDDRPIASISGEAATFQVEHLLAGGLAEQAERCLDKALEHLERRHDPERMERLVETFTRLARPDAGRRGWLRLRAASLAARFSGRRREVRQRLRHVIEDAHLAADAELEARCLIELASVEARRDDEAARAAIEQARPLVESLHVPALDCWWAAKLAGLAIRQARWKEAEIAVQRSLDGVSHVASDEVRILIFTESGNLAHVRGERETARRRYAEALSVARSVGAAVHEARLLGNIGQLDLWLGRLDAARESLKAQGDLARELGLLRPEAAALGYLALCDLRSGDPVEARARAQRQLALAREIEDEALCFNATILRAWLDRQDGDPVRSLERLEALGASRSQHVTVNMMARWAEARIALDIGRASKALRVGETLLAEADELGLDEIASHAGVLVASVREAEDAALALTHLERAHAIRRRLGIPWETAESANAIGRIGVLSPVTGNGPSAGALAHLEEAAAIVEQHGFVEPGPAPAAWLAAAGCRDPGSVVVPLNVPVPVRAEAHVALFMAGAGTHHRSQAQGLLERMARGLEGEARHRILRDSPLARWIGRATDR